MAVPAEAGSREETSSFSRLIAQLFRHCNCVFDQKEGMEPECKFWGLRIPSGKAVDVEPEFDPDFITSIHLTQAALGAKPKLGPHTLLVESDGEEFALGTLDKEKCTHFSLDIHLATNGVKLRHTGASDVYLTGYQATSVTAGPYSDDEGLGGADAQGVSIMPLGEGGSDDDDEEEESDDEEAPAGVPIQNGKGAQLRMIDDEAEETSDEEDDDGEEGSEESDDDEEEDGLMGSSEEESKEDEEDSEGEDSEEEAEEEPPVPAKLQKKRPAAQAPAATPQPPKRGRQEAAQKAVPATAPPKVAAAAKAAPGGAGGEYLAALKQHLASKGPTKLASLGSAVKRPPKAPKLKHFLEQHAGVFKYDAGTDMVSLKA